VAQQVNPPRGMRDFLPDEKARREAILAIIRRTYRAHGFDEIETPVVEDADRLHAGLGGDNEKLAFAVMRRGLTVDDLREAASPLALADLGLRFDLTVPLARFVATHRAELPPVFRAIQIAPVWRAERPQKGRYRQFVQCDIDIVGEAGALAEVELLTASVAAIRALGIAESTIRVNDRRILTAMLAHFGFAAEEADGVLVTVDKLDKVGPAGVAAELRDRGATPSAVDALVAFLEREVTQAADFGADAIRAALPEGLSTPAIDELAAIGAAVNAAVGAQAVAYDPWLVRGMGYYTGAIFEVVHPALGYSFGGGGRYDGMIGRFLGDDVPAVGFSLGFERLVDLVDLPASTGDAPVALVHAADADPSIVVAVRDRLVADGRRVRLLKRPKRLAAALDALAASGVGEWVAVDSDTDPSAVEIRAIG